MKQTLRKGLWTLLAVMLFWACSSESYPGLTYEDPNHIENDETPPDSVGLPIHVYVNEQSVFSLTSSSASARSGDDTRGVGAFQIEADEDVNGELDTLMQLKKDTTTFYVFAFRDRKAKQVYADIPDAQRLIYEPNLHDWYSKASGNIPSDVEGKDVLRLDCLVDGYDYYKGMPANVDSANQALKMQLSVNSHLYWSEYQGVSYNFFAYTVGDINKSPDAKLQGDKNNVDEVEHIQWGIPHRDKDSIWYENFAIDGSQDLMVGYAPPITDELLKDRYKHIKLSEGERNRIIHDGNYTSFAAHRNIEPQIDMKHLLTRLRFWIMPGDSAATYTTIDSVYVITPYKGNFVVAVNNYLNLDQVGFKPNPNNFSKIYLHETPEFIRDADGKAIGLEPTKILDAKTHCIPWLENYWKRDPITKEIVDTLPLNARDKERLGDDMMIPEAEQIVLGIWKTLTKTDRSEPTTYALNAETQCGGNTANTKYYDSATGTFRFKRGYIYDIYIVIYGDRQIQVGTNIEAWKDGGVIIVDPDS